MKDKFFVNNIIMKDEFFVNNIIIYIKKSNTNINFCYER